jgi:hypothetical protein
MPLYCEHVESGLGDLVRGCRGELESGSLRDGAHGRADVDHLLELALFEKRDEGIGDAVDGENIDIEDVLEVRPEVGGVKVSLSESSRAGSQNLHMGSTTWSKRHDTSIVDENV